MEKKRLPTVRGGGRGERLEDEFKLNYNVAANLGRFHSVYVQLAWKKINKKKKNKKKKAITSLRPNIDPSERFPTKRGKTKNNG